MQLDPAKYNQGMVSAFRTVVANEGVAVLATGLGATAAGYFVQGFFKFGGVLLLCNHYIADAPALMHVPATGRILQGEHCHSRRRAQGVGAAH